MVTPRTRTCSLGVMVSSPRHRFGPQPSSSDRLCFVPVHNNYSVLSALSFNRLADIQSQTSVMQCSSSAAAEAVLQQSQCTYSCDSSAYVWKLIPYSSILSGRSAVYKINSRGPSTDLCGTEQKMATVHDALPPYTSWNVLFNKYDWNQSRDQTDAEVGLHTAKCGPQCQKQLSGPVDRGQTSVHHSLQTADHCKSWWLRFPCCGSGGTQTGSSASGHCCQGRLEVDAGWPCLIT